MTKMDNRCIKQLNNHGIECNDAIKKCFSCGWNPSVFRQRKSQREKAYKLNVPLHCADCMLVKMCIEAGCIKQGCSHKKTSYVNTDEIAAEMKDRQ